MTFNKAIIVVVFLLGFEGPGWAGSRINDGADSVTSFLELVRKSVVETLDRIHKLDDAAHHDALRIILINICKSSQRLSSPLQRENCADFILETAAQIIACNVPKIVTPLQAMNPDDNFIVEYPGGKLITADAVTKHGGDCSDPILFNFPIIRKLQLGALVPMMYHEFGHKVSFRNHSRIHDIGAVGDFDNGVDLLSMAGSAIYRFGVTNYLDYGFGAPSISDKPDAFIPAHDWFQCELDINGHSNESFRVKTHRMQPSSDLFYIVNDSPSPLGFDLTSYTKNDLPNVELYLRFFISEGGGCEEQSPRDSTSIDLLEVIGDKGKSVGIHLRPRENMTCKNRANDFTIDYGALHLRCVYDGFFPI